MKTISLPIGQPLEYYLEQEEYLSEHCSEEYFFVWQTSPTVICGRNQVIEEEVNIPFCEAHHIAICRRQSGGGCVYSDEGNLMLSFVLRDRHSQQVFQATIERLAEALRGLGLPAVTTRHNDILAEGRKISGSACRRTRGGTIVHSTLLLSSNIEMLRQAITPSAEKLSHNGVQSVRQRVVTLEELAQEGVIAPISTTAIRDHLTRFFCGENPSYQPIGCPPIGCPPIGCTPIAEA